MPHPLLSSALSEPIVLTSLSPIHFIWVSSMSGLQIILFAAGLILCCASDLSLLCGPLPSQPSSTCCDQPAHFTWGFLEHWTWSAKTGTVPGKLGQLVTLCATFIISVAPKFNCSTNSFYKLVTSWQATWRGCEVSLGTVAGLLTSDPLCFVHCLANLFPLEGGLYFYFFQSSWSPNTIFRSLLFWKFHSRFWWYAYTSETHLT